LSKLAAYENAVIPPHFEKSLKDLLEIVNISYIDVIQNYSLLAFYLGSRHGGMPTT
jgi:hypothetical protein